MKRQLGYVIWLLLAIFGSTLSACRPTAAIVPTATPAGTDTPVPTVTNTPRPTRTPTPTPQPTLDASTLLKWTFETGNAIWGPPTVSEGIVYFGSDDHYLYAVDASTGQLKWKLATEGLVRSRPAIANGLIYVASDDGSLYAVELSSGNQAWRTDIGNVTELEVRERLGNSPNPAGYDYVQSSPTVADGRVYVGSADGYVYALAADSGQVIWTFKTDAQVRAQPTVDGGVVYIGSWDKSFYALDAASGELRWTTPLDGQVQTTALVADGLVYCASRKASVVAMDVQTGEKKWEHSYGNNMWVESSPFLVDDTVYIGSSGSQVINALDSQKGNTRAWFVAESFCWSRPVVVGEMLYIGCTNTPSARNGLLALEFIRDKSSGQVRDFVARWRFSLKETLEPGGNWYGVASWPVLVEGVLYFGGLDGKFYALGVQ